MARIELPHVLSADGLITKAIGVIALVVAIASIFIQSDSSDKTKVTVVGVILAAAFGSYLVWFSLRYAIALSRRAGAYESLCEQVKEEQVRLAQFQASIALSLRIPVVPGDQIFSDRTVH